MRISDWSSDVGSSDRTTSAPWPAASSLSAQKAAGSFAVEVGKQIEEIGWVLDEAGNSRFVAVIDRKSVVLGKRVSVRVDLGGCRYIKKKKCPNDDMTTV